MGLFWPLEEGEETSMSTDDAGASIVIEEEASAVVLASDLVDFTKLNGPTRQIPGTQHTREPMPSLQDEPEWMKLSTVCPAPAGSVLLRDVRAWHGGTPNLSNDVRAIPSVQFYAPWFRDPVRRALPRAAWEQLSDHGRRVSRYAIMDDGGPSTPGAVLGATPPGF